MYTPTIYFKYILSTDTSRCDAGIKIRSAEQGVIRQRSKLTQEYKFINEQWQK